MVPPALSEVRKDVLPRELNYLVKETPQMKDISISNNECGQKPIADVHQEIMVNIVPKVFNCEVAMVVIGMHLLSHWLVKSWV
jgi:hypothetical protein